MFGFLKDKLKEAIGKFSKKVDESVEDEEVVEEKTTKKIVPEKKDQKKPVVKTVEKKVQTKNIPSAKSTDKKSSVKSPVKEKAKTSPKADDRKQETKTDKKEAKGPVKKASLKKESDSIKKDDVIIPEKNVEHKKGFFESLKDKFSKPKIVEETVGTVAVVSKTKEHIEPLESVENDHDALDDEEERSEEAGELDDSDVEIEESKIIPDLVDESVEEESEELEESEGSEDSEESDSENVSEDDSEEETSDEIEDEPEKSPESPDDDVSDSKKSFFGAISDVFTKKSLTEEKFEQLFFELEMVLLENNVAYEVVDKIKSDLSKRLVNARLSRGKIQDVIISSLKESIEGLFDLDYPNLMKLAREKKDKPFVIAMMGVNGSGKTTTLAKLGYHFKSNGLSCVFAAGDTFRAAAIQQLEEHAKALDIKIIKQDYGADSAAVAFDAVKFAKSKGIDVVLIDTAGRLHSNTNLMNELKKVIRVSNADFKIFVGEAITGNDCVEQAVKFNEELGIDGIILTKADIDDKGGASISVSYVTKKPILYLGMGQSYPELEEFESKKIVESLGL